MKITVFGGSTPKPGDQVYDDALLLGKLLGASGHTVLNGGYTGTMEAVSRGASEAGAHVIGVTCGQIENWRKSGANQWVTEVWRCETLDERIRTMIDHCDVAIALPGGVGTLTEIMAYWNRLAIRSMKKHPLIVIGRGWHEVLGTFISSQGEFLAPDDEKSIAFAEDVQAAVKMIEKVAVKP